MDIILASASPRRRELLSLICQNFSVKVSNASENFDECISVFDVPKILAQRKAESIDISDNEIVIGCDTIVISDNKIMGKPRDRDDAINMLCSFSGKAHIVASGLCIRSKSKVYSESALTTVYMREISKDEIIKYVDTCKPFDKAGAYGIQEMAGAFVKSIDGDFYNIVGLPICRLTEIFKNEFGVSLI